MAKISRQELEDFRRSLGQVSKNEVDELVITRIIETGGMCHNHYAYYIKILMFIIHHNRQ